MTKKTTLIQHEMGPGYEVELMIITYANGKVDLFLTDTKKHHKVDARLTPAEVAQIKSVL